VRLRPIKLDFGRYVIRSVNFGPRHIVRLGTLWRLFKSVHSPDARLGPAQTFSTPIGISPKLIQTRASWPESCISYILDAKVSIDIEVPSKWYIRYLLSYRGQKGRYHVG
jgi:hypothetical protein